MLFSFQALVRINLCSWERLGVANNSKILRYKVIFFFFLFKRIKSANSRQALLPHRGQQWSLVWRQFDPTACPQNNTPVIPAASSHSRGFVLLWHSQADLTSSSWDTDTHFFFLLSALEPKPHMAKSKSPKSKPPKSQQAPAALLG